MTADTSRRHRLAASVDTLFALFQRLSTRFNFYTALWTDFFMSDIQQSILEVVRRRCEKAGAP